MLRTRGEAEQATHGDDWQGCTVAEWKTWWWHKDLCISTGVTWVVAWHNRGDTDAGGRDGRWMEDGSVSKVAWMALMV